MEKVAVTSVEKPKPQRTKSESLQKTEEQTQESDFELAFKSVNGLLHDGGRAIDLSGIAAYAGLSTNPDQAPRGNENASGDNEEHLQPGEKPAKQNLADEIEEVTTKPTATQIDTVQEQQADALIADDSAAELSEGQMRKTAFLQKLRTEICGTIEPVLAAVGQTTDECPYLNYWLELYEGKDAAHIERTAKKYSHGIALAKTAEEYISIIAQRALKAALIWAKTGKVTGVPDGVPTTLPGHQALQKNNKERQGKLVQFKLKKGAAKNADDPGTIQKELGKGQPLASGVRSRMELAFGVNLSHVRTHTDSTATAISNSVNARAFTVGNHIAFGNGEYQPGTLVGDALIAHELAHTIQQKGAEHSVNKVEVGDTGYDLLEKDADKTAEGAVRSLWGREQNDQAGIAAKTSTRLRSGLRLQRCGGSQTKPTTPPTQVQTPPAVANGACDRTSKARTYTPTEGSVTPTLAEGDFGTTSKLAAFPTYGACGEDGTWRFYLTALVVNIKSAVRPINYRKNVPNANDGIVTASTYRPIVSDLIPTRSGTFHPSCGGNRFDDPVTTYSKRTEYWNHQFVVDHEAFHRTNWNDMYRPNLIAAEDKILAHAIPESQATSASDAISQSRSALDGFMIEAYQQTCQQYTPRQESRAYDNGAPQYQALVDAIRARATSEGWTTPQPQPKPNP